MKRCMTVFVMLCIYLACAQSAPSDSDITLAANDHGAVLALRRSASFRELDAPCGIAYQLYADGTLEVYTLIARRSSDEAELTHVSTLSPAEYQDIQLLLNKANVMAMPSHITNDILDGEMVTLTLWTTEGEKTVTSQSPNGLPFGDVADALEAIFRPHKDEAAAIDLVCSDCMPPEPTYTPDMPSYHKKEGDAYYRQGEYEKAIASYEAAIALDASFMHGHYGLAVTYRAMGLLERSIDSYTAVIAIAPDYAQPYASRAELYQFLHRYDEAEADLNQYVHLYGQYPVPYIVRGDFLMTQGDDQRAAEDYTAALGKGISESALTTVYLKRAEAWLRLFELDKAEADFQLVLEHATW